MYKFIIYCFVIINLAGISDATPKPIDGRIVGGQDANIEDFPYQLAYMLNGEEQCGAVLIHPKWALTAGHCTFGIYDLSTIAILYNTSYLSKGESTRISRIIKNPNYNYNTKVNDIAILELADTLDCKNCKPISLSRTTPKTGENLTVTGWGVTDEDSEVSPDHMKVVSVPIYSHQVCREFYATNKYPVYVTDDMFCAGYEEISGKGTCFGDSGGPGVVDGKLNGLASWGLGCGRPNSPRVYTKVASFIDWIEKETGLSF